MKIPDFLSKMIICLLWVLMLVVFPNMGAITWIIGMSLIAVLITYFFS